MIMKFEVNSLFSAFCFSLFAGNISSSIGNMVNLLVLHLYSNKLTGLYIDNTIVFTHFYCIHSFLGSLPVEIGNLTSLTSLNLSDNKFTDSVPLLNMLEMTDLSLHNNFFDGNS